MEEENVNTPNIILNNPKNERFREKTAPLITKIKEEKSKNF